MSSHRMEKLGIHAALPEVETPDCRQHDEEKGNNRGGGDSAGSRHRRPGSLRRYEQNGDDGEGQDQHADIFRARGEPDEEAEQDGATLRRFLQQPDQRGEREHEKAGEKNVLLEEAGMHGEERSRRRGRRGRQGWQVGQQEPCQNEGGKHEDAACHDAKHPHEMRQGGQIWRLHHEAAACPRSIMRSG